MLWFKKVCGSSFTPGQSPELLTLFTISASALNSSIVFLLALRFRNSSCHFRKFPKEGSGSAPALRVCNSYWIREVSMGSGPESGALVTIIYHKSLEKYHCGFLSSGAAGRELKVENIIWGDLPRRVWTCLGTGQCACCLGN